ncbi:MAG TPA: hypothetical protein VE954_10235 [Oligoflexus sp.]|uniref:hypothetical protein n=1 Tax=Oligoflexus sp. TaxID=1971216 RepID=UPI002D23CF05|nr:hypothetical protein [Oligoflexus sp.]HYX33481.1 hypothetical protein [Oligoflexus sp.]
MTRYLLLALLAVGPASCHVPETSRISSNVEPILVETTSSIVNTTYNTWEKDRRWEATMGPLNPQKGGIVCDQVDAKFRTSEYALWFVAPSDVIAELGLKRCGPNPHGGEPSCVENWQLCGRKLKVQCKVGSRWCATPGQPSLRSDFSADRRPVNNYVPDYYVQETRSVLGAAPATPESIVLYITDFCPAAHSSNQVSGHCQKPQLDLSTAAFLLLSQQNAQGY